MTTDKNHVHRRVAVLAALANTARLRIVDTLTVGDASPSELSTMLAMPSNLIAHHLRVLEAEGIIVRTPSEGDRRRTYLRLVHTALNTVTTAPIPPISRVLFVCTANSARSHLAAALWRRVSEVQAASAGTHPAPRIDPAALATAERHQLPLRRMRPRHVDEVRVKGDLIITVCDLAHEELGQTAQLHWSVPDPGRVGSADAYDHTVDELTRRVGDLAPRLSAAPVAS